MATEIPRTLLELKYEKAAYEYMRKLPMEHFVESIAQSTQRKITLESFDLVRARRRDVQVFSELLVQYPRRRGDRLGQVVPDNMVIRDERPVRAQGSFNLPLEETRPFWMFEYVSKHDPTKDYDKCFRIYEQDLKVPYYLVFWQETQDLTLYRLREEKYVSVPPNEQGRHPIPELEMEVAILDGWVRYWYQGELLPLPADLDRELTEVKRQLEAEKHRADAEKHRADAEKHRADVEKHRADAEKHRADAEKHRADAEKHRAEELQQTLEEKARALQSAEEELARLRARREPKKKNG